MSKESIHIPSKGSTPTFRHTPGPQGTPAFVTTDINSNSLPPDLLDGLNDLMVRIGGISIENIAMKRFLSRMGQWEAFVQYFDWEWIPEKEPRSPLA